MINKNEIPYWMALTHDSGWNYEQTNNFIMKINYEEKNSIEKFFDLSSNNWSDHFGFTKEEIETLEKVRENIPKYSFLAEDLFEQGYEVIPIKSAEYPKILKENLQFKSPPVLYVKGNRDILKESSIAIVGSRNASKTALSFTDNIARLASREHNVVVSGFAKGVDRQALDSALKYNCKSIIVLPQGILTFHSGFKEYYRQIVGGNILVLSSFFPKAEWSVQLAMARNPVIYGLAKEIYVAESGQKGGTWSGVIDGLRKKRDIYIRNPEPGENNANNELISRGAIAVNFEGQPVLEYKLILPEISLVKEDEDKELDAIIFKVLGGKVAVTSKQILKKTNLNWSVRKLTDYLKTKKEIEILNKKPISFKLKDSGYQTKIS